MKSLEIGTILQEIMSADGRASDVLKRLPSYETFINNLSNNCSNEELESLQYLCQELGRNLEYDVIPSKAEKEFYIGIDNTKDNRKNNIELRVWTKSILRLSYGDKCIDSRSLRNETVTIPFYKNKYETIEPIYSKFDELCAKYNILNKIEIENKIEEYTGIKRKV